jgi:outer membrane protein OmpA-like peptidoglycan-associated protein
MAGLMMVFLLIAVAFMLEVQQSKIEIENQMKAMAEIAVMVERSRKNLYSDLLMAFAGDLERWNAEILADNTVRFKAPDVLFQRGDHRLQARFKEILNSFFPRYVTILQDYRTEIKAVRIEGHTSSDWANGYNAATAYLGNLRLSQKRALTTLEYCYQLSSVQVQQKWLEQVLMTNGWSFAKLILNADGSENVEKSRRVEFKVITKAVEKLDQILKRSRE